MANSWPSSLLRVWDSLPDLPQEVGLSPLRTHAHVLPPHPSLVAPFSAFISLCCSPWFPPNGEAPPGQGLFRFVCCSTWSEVSFQQTSRAWVEGRADKWKDGWHARYGAKELLPLCCNGSPCLYVHML